MLEYKHNMCILKIIKEYDKYIENSNKYNIRRQIKINTIRIKLYGTKTIIRKHSLRPKPIKINNEYTIEILVQNSPVDELRDFANICKYINF